MATTIDSLVVTLGLDPRKFTQGQREAMSAFKRMQDDARKYGKETEEAARRMTGFFSKLKGEALGFGLALLGGRGVKEIVSFLTTTDAALDRLAKRTGHSTEGLSKWRGALYLAGGQAEDMDAAVASLIQDFEQLQITGQSKFLPLLNAFNIDQRGKDALTLLREIGQHFEKMTPRRAQGFGAAFGFSPELTALLQGGKLPAFLKEMERLGLVSGKSAEGSTRLQHSWRAAETAAMSLARVVLTDLSPAMEGFLGKITDLLVFYRQNKGSWQTITDLAFFLANPFAGAYRIGSNLNRIGAGGGAEPPPASGGNFAIKEGAGSFSKITEGLARVAADIPGFKQITAAQDVFHRGRKSLHNEGRAIDFTITDPNKSGEAVEALKAKLAEMGITANIIDEYKDRSPGSTGGHIHVAVPANGVGAAAQRGQAAASRTEVTINGGVNITSGASDGKGIASDFIAEIRARAGRLNTAIPANN